MGVPGPIDEALWKDYLSPMPALSVSSVLMTVEEYLAAEERSEVKHEYLAGVPYAMAGASLEHNTITSNLGGACVSRLRGKRCRHFGSDMKLSLRRSTSSYFYYPDAMIVCGLAVLGPSWCEQPSVIFEVLSESTRLIDEREKRMAYLDIASLDAYVRIEQDERLVVVERRTATGWTREILTEPSAVLSLPTVEVEFPIAELYERLSV
jgi:Uma2 family endonuclease